MIYKLWLVKESFDPEGDRTVTDKITIDLMQSDNHIFIDQVISHLVDTACQCVEWEQRVRQEEDHED